MSLIKDLIKDNWLKTPRIVESFKKIKREDFLPEDLKKLAELNEALPIGYNQTISQPLVVAFMLEKMQPEPGEKILDIGSGSGWTTALLSEMVGDKGKVIGIEIIPELVEFGRKNLGKYSFVEKKISDIIQGDGSLGYVDEAPFDKILCSASAEELPKLWKKQLKVGGRIVVPIGYSIWVFEKKSAKEFIEEEFPGFNFVPLIHK